MPYPNVQGAPLDRLPILQPAFDSGSLDVMRGFSSDSISGVKAANLAPNPRVTEKLPPLKRSATPPPIGTIGRHFSSRRFADAPISDASKAGMKHEYVL